MPQRAHRISTHQPADQHVSAYPPAGHDGPETGLGGHHVGPARGDVVIVGAGLAGLRCASVLEHAGLSVTVLEASDAVGGRVRTDVIDGFAESPSSAHWNFPTLWLHPEAGGAPSKMAVSDHAPSTEGALASHADTGGRHRRSRVAPAGLDDLRDRPTPGPGPQDHPRLPQRRAGRRGTQACRS